MARTAGTFGTVELLASGRYRARYRHLGKRWTAPETFNTEKLARGYLASVEYAIDSGNWLPPEQADPVRPEKPREVPTFRAFAESWISDRETGAIGNRAMKPRTAQEYRSLLKRTVYPSIGNKTLDAITETDIERWHRKQQARKTPTQTARAYDLMRTIFTQAIKRKHIMFNPCQIDGAGSEGKSKHQPEVVTPEQIESLADSIGYRLRCAVLLGAWCALRFGEITALRRKDVDVENQTVKVTRGAVRLTGKGVQIGDPKTDAGKRVVAIPGHIMPELRKHLARIPAEGDALLFPSAADQAVPIAQSSFYRHWDRARRAVGLDDFHFHDLRHTGATMAAQVGATIGELQHRLGHSTPGAAMRYQHATEERDKTIARDMSRAAQPKKSKPAKEAVERYPLTAVQSA